MRLAEKGVHKEGSNSKVHLGRALAYVTERGLRLVACQQQPHRRRGRLIRASAVCVALVCAVSSQAQKASAATVWLQAVSLLAHGALLRTMLPPEPHCHTAARLLLESNCLLYALGPGMVSITAHL